MTDITELAQRMRSAAGKATKGQWVAFTDTASRTFSVHTPDDNRCGDVIKWAGFDGQRKAKANAEFIALANPANVLALVEALEKAQQRITQLESRTVKLLPEFYTIGELIRTQDNRITDQPMFVVFQKREIIGSDEHSPSRICWVWDGEEVSELRAKRLEALYQDGRDTRGYDRYAMQEVDDFVTACFTEHGCKEYLRQNGHNLRQPYIYACGSFRNNEYQLVRNWLAGIKVEAE
ncbi:ead/Ea22-like family protein [Klebsiella michiganensis]|uniref:ead/Ea22-like family protein n=1 Tax=Klebsiella michiganensis TaxID=1134687 RepID=UPI00374BD9B2